MRTGTRMTSEAAPVRRRLGGLAYAVVTLGAAAIAIVATSAEPDRTWGIATAWAIQAVAFWRLDRSLAAARNATAAWIGGMFARGGGLVVTGLLAYAGVATADLPIAYGITMLALLLLEAGWLARSLPRPTSVRRSGDVNEHDRTHSTG